MKNLFFIFFIFIHCLVLGQTTILFEDFNDGFPNGWQLIDQDGYTPYNDPAVNFIDEAWVIHEDYDSTGINDSILISTSWFVEDGYADDYLILPSVTLGTYGNYLSFDIKSKDQSNPDGLEVLFSTTDLSPWTFTHNEIIYNTENAPSYWTNISVSLDSVGLTNQNVMLAFRHFGIDKFILEIDNIKITTNDPIGINQPETSPLTIYPNPSEGKIHLQGLKESIHFFVTDINGKKVRDGITNGEIQLDLDAGIYFLHLKNNEIEKIIIQ